MTTKKEHRLNDQEDKELETDNEATAEGRVTGLAKRQGANEACLLFQVDTLLLLTTAADTTTIMVLLRVNTLRHFILVEESLQDDGNGG